MTYEERVDAVAAALMDDAGGWWPKSEFGQAGPGREAREEWRRRARVALKAAGIEPPTPTWPTQEMIEAVRVWLSDDEDDNFARAALIAAWNVDPRRKVYEAALNLRDWQRLTSNDVKFVPELQAVIDAVNEAEP